MLKKHVNFQNVGHTAIKLPYCGGTKQCFPLGRYHSMVKSKAVHGGSLVKLSSLIETLLKVAPHGEINYDPLRKARCQPLFGSLQAYLGGCAHDILFLGDANCC